MENLTKHLTRWKKSTQVLRIGKAIETEPVRGSQGLGGKGWASVLIRVLLL